MKVNFPDSTELQVVIDLDDIYSETDKMDYLRTHLSGAIYRGLAIASNKIIEKLEQNIAKYNVNSLIDGINVEYDADSILIEVSKIDGFNGEDYASYVEFGTGIVGSWNSHPEPWDYDVNNWGYKGWWYEDGDGYHWTRGMPARPYMYDTVQWIRSYSPIKRAINKEIRKLIK